MFGLGVQELMIILIIAMLFFGGKKIPEIAKGLGKGIREFKHASEGKDDAEDDNRRLQAEKSRTETTIVRKVQGGRRAHPFTMGRPTWPGPC